MGEDAASGGGSGCAFQASRDAPQETRAEALYRHDAASEPAPAKAGDGSREAWLAGQPKLDFVVTMDDASRQRRAFSATSEIYSAFLVEEEGTHSTFRGLLEVFVAHGLPSSLYTDRGSHYFHTSKAGEAVDKERPTQVGRALDRLGVEHIPAYSPEARPCAAWLRHDAGASGSLGSSPRAWFGTLQSLPPRRRGTD